MPYNAEGLLLLLVEICYQLVGVPQSLHYSVYIIIKDSDKNSIFEKQIMHIRLIANSTTVHSPDISIA